jgi:RHS repeat-associated protein
MYIKTVVKFAVGALLALVASLSTQAIAQSSTAPSGPITYLQNDLTGNVILATDASGATVWEERYLPYGGKRLGTSSSQKYGYHQKALDPETGLQYFGARYYDPLSGRFSGMDPLAPTESNIYTFNRYAFANGNPYRYTDPDGKVVIDLVFVAYDIYTLATEGATATNLIATGLDVASTFGFGFGAGSIYRVARAAERATEGARAIEAGVHTAESAKDSIEAARRAAVRNAWKEEKALVAETGEGTRAWTDAETKQLLEKGKVDGYHGHHINNVKDHPELAGNPDNIKFVKGGSEHLAEHGGNYRNKTTGELIDRSIP